MQKTMVIAKKEQEISGIFTLLKFVFEGKNPPEIPWEQLPQDSQLQTMIYYYFRNTLPPELKSATQASYYKFTIAEMPCRKRNQNGFQLLK